MAPYGLYKKIQDNNSPLNSIVTSQPDYFEIKDCDNGTKLTFYNTDMDILYTGFETKCICKIGNNREDCSKSKGKVFKSKKSTKTSRSGYGSKFGRPPSKYQSSHLYFKTNDGWAYANNYIFENGDTIGAFYTRE